MKLLQDVAHLLMNICSFCNFAEILKFCRFGAVLRSKTNAFFCLNTFVQSMMCILLQKKFLSIYAGF
ncbi:hypothetical protein X975_22856, partial [Stegodyphus mimosarum]